MRSFEDDEIWDEFQWEAHLTEMEQKSEKIRTFIESNLGEETPRWSRFLKNFPSKLDAIDAYIEDELMFEDAYFPDDEDDWDEEDDDDEMDDFFMSGEDMDEDDEDLDDGEEWKISLPKSESDDADEEASQAPLWMPASELAEFENMDEEEPPEYTKIYDEARELAADMLKLAELVPEEEQDAYFIEMVSETVNLGTKVAGGFAFGYDLDVLGGNIAYCKRALKSANRLLELLPGLKRRKFMRFADYRMLHERMFELRNELGIHIQEMREVLNDPDDIEG